MVFISFTLYNENYLLMWPKLSNAIFSKLVFIVSRAYPSDREKRDELSIPSPVADPGPGVGGGGQQARASSKF